MSVISMPQPLSRMGAEMMGVDAVEKNIGVASVHAVYPRIPLEKFISIFNYYIKTILRPFSGRRSVINVYPVIEVSSLLKGNGDLFNKGWIRSMKAWIILFQKQKRARYCHLFFYFTVDYVRLETLLQLLSNICVQQLVSCRILTKYSNFNFISFLDLPFLGTTNQSCENIRYGTGFY